MSEEHASVARRRSRAEAEELVAEYAASGLSRKEFCRRRGLAVGTLDKYRKQQGRQAESGGEGRLVAVELCGVNQASESGASSGLAVLLARGRRIEVRGGFDTQVLEQLVRVLEQV